MYRFYQVLAATHSPHKALAESSPSAAMLGGIFMEATVASIMGFEPQVPDGIEFTRDDYDKYYTQATRVVEWFGGTGNVAYQPALAWPWAKGRIVDGIEIEAPESEGHPDFIIDSGWIVDLKTTDYPTEELLNKLLHSIQMCAYMAAFERMYERSPSLSIVLASRLEQPDPVKFNKDGSVSLSGQNADSASLRDAVELMGDKADDRHWAMVFKAPVWNPIMVGSLGCDECHELAKVGTLFLDAGLAILNTGLSESVFRPYA
jgi:hypothetical protein